MSNVSNGFDSAIRRSAKASIVLLGLVAASGAAQATLLARDLTGDSVIDAYYDTVFDITWLKNASYAASELSDVRRDAIIANVGSVPDVSIPGGHALTTSDFQKSGAAYTGRMTWWGAMAWAQDLTVGSYSDWRLSPISFTGKDLGNPCHVYKVFGGAAGAPYCAATGNELAYMYYYNLDGSGQPGPDEDKTGNQTFDGATLTNIKGTYWTSSENWRAAWIFSFYGGWTDGDGSKEEAFPDYYSAWATHPGDVGLAIPEPATVALLGLALAGLGFSRRSGLQPCQRSLRDVSRATSDDERECERAEAGEVEQ